MSVVTAIPRRTGGAHYTHAMPIPLAARFAAKLDRRSPEECWPWRGFIDKAGYGRIRLGGRTEPVGYAHRVSYELEVGPVPDGLHLDHLCRVRECCNPRHLEPVTPATNVMRGVSPAVALHLAGTCARGHDAALSYRRKSTGRVVYCRACRREDRQP